MVFESCCGGEWGGLKQNRLIVYTTNADEDIKETRVITLLPANHRALDDMTDIVCVKHGMLDAWNFCIEIPRSRRLIHAKRYLQLKVAIRTWWTLSGPRLLASRHYISSHRGRSALKAARNGNKMHPSSPFPFASVFLSVFTLPPLSFPAPFWFCEPNSAFIVSHLNP